jgi:hypothetical protein
MLVHVFLNGTNLGSANLTRLDPPMGVAMGSFEPTNNYDRLVHANTVDGTFMGHIGKSFSLVSDVYGTIESVGAAIEDFYDSLGERELTVVGITHPNYADIFCKYDDYKAYYTQA